MKRPTAGTTDAPLLAVEGLKRWFVRRSGPFGVDSIAVRAVDGVSLDVMPGEAVGLVGESGCGKSTVGRMIMGLEKPDAGVIRIDGHDIATAPAATRRALTRRRQMVFQDPYASLNPRLSVGAALAEPLRVVMRLDRRATTARVAALLEEVGLPTEAAERYPHEFSGGQRQRIAIARALALEPDLIVADEPVSALDVSIQAQVLALMRSAMADRRLAFLFISHDLGVVRQFCARTAVMYLGRIVEAGPTRRLFDAPRHPYTRALIAASPVPEPGRSRAALAPGEPASAAAPPPGCHFHPRCPAAAAPCRTIYPAWRGVAADGAACHLNDPAMADAMKGDSR